MRYGPVVTRRLASAIRLNDRPRCAREIVESAVPRRLAALARIISANDRSARGKSVTSETKKVPAIAIILGMSRLIFCTGSNRTRNRIVISDTKQMVEDLDTTSATYFQEARSFPF